MTLPDTTQRTVIVGRTGTGKTVGGMWLLSRASYTYMPWLIYDFKGDKLIRQLEEMPNVYVVGLNEIPTKPGIYIVRPNPALGPEVMEPQMLSIWERENIGVFLDEGYMVNKVPSLTSLLTQGRSKHIPMIILTQRPLWINKFTFTEADFFMVYQLTYQEDQKEVQRYLPREIRDANTLSALPQYHSLFHEVKDNRSVILRPVEPPDKIMERFYNRLSGMKVRRVGFV